ncbi:hypothetical protein [Myxococcus faecalis]|uniref:hypothetical protein n=1 Tax=Myxococcus faecalis TaxID=3115646 RepID=UPI003CF59990
MSPLRNWLCLCSVFTLLLATPEGARAQVGSSYPSEPAPAQPAYPPQDPAPSTPPEPSPLPPVDPYADPRMAEPPPSNTVPASPPDPATMPRVDNPPQTSDVPRADAPDLRQSPLTQDGTPASLTPSASATPPPYVDSGAILDGRQRLGPFLSGPGSFRFIAHHTALGALGGFFTQAFANDFDFDQSSREAMLAGTLIGAGLGFGASSWWQFNNWVDKPMASFTIINSGVGGAFMAGFMDLFTQDAGVLTWSAFLGAELGAWLTAGLGGGQLPLNDGLLISSGAGWGAAYAALLLAVIHFSGTDISSKTWRDTLLLAPGIGAGALALATMRYNPTPSQILRADLFGAGVGAAVLLISGLVLGGFDQSTPYVLSFLGSAGAITTVSLLWEESVDRSALKNAKDRPYRNVWW